MGYSYSGQSYSDLLFLKDFMGNSMSSDIIKDVSEHIRTRLYNITISRAKYGILGRITHTLGAINNRKGQTQYFRIDDQTASKIQEWAKSGNWNEAHSATIDMEAKFEKEKQYEKSINEAFRKCFQYRSLIETYERSTNTKEKIKILNEANSLKSSNKEELFIKIADLKKSLKEKTTKEKQVSDKKNHVKEELNESNEFSSNRDNIEVFQSNKTISLEEQQRLEQQKKNENYLKQVQQEAFDMEKYTAQADVQFKSGNFFDAANTYAKAGQNDLAKFSFGVGVGSTVLGVISDIKADKIATHTGYLKEYLNEVSNTYEAYITNLKNGEWEAFFSMGLKLYKSESGALYEADWLKRKADATYGTVIGKIHRSRKNRKIKIWNLLKGNKAAPELIKQKYFLQAGIEDDAYFGSLSNNLYLLNDATKLNLFLKVLNGTSSASTKDYRMYVMLLSGVNYYHPLQNVRNVRVHFVNNQDTYKNRYPRTFQFFEKIKIIDELALKGGNSEFKNHTDEEFIFLFTKKTNYKLILEQPNIIDKVNTIYNLYEKDKSWKDYLILIDTYMNYSTIGNNANLYYYLKGLEAKTKKEYVSAADYFLKVEIEINKFLKANKYFSYNNKLYKQLLVDMCLNYSLAGNKKGIGSSCTLAVEKSPSYNSYLYYGKALIDQFGDVKKGIEQLLKASEYSNDGYYVYAYLSELYLKEKQFEDAYLTATLAKKRGWKDYNTQKEKIMNTSGEKWNDLKKKSKSKSSVVNRALGIVNTIREGYCDKIEGIGNEVEVTYKLLNWDEFSKEYGKSEEVYYKDMGFDFSEKKKQAKIKYKIPFNNKNQKHGYGYVIFKKIVVGILEFKNDEIISRFDLSFSFSMMSQVVPSQYRIYENNKVVKRYIFSLLQFNKKVSREFEISKNPALDKLVSKRHKKIYLSRLSKITSYSYDPIHVKTESFGELGEVISTTNTEN